MEFGCKKAKFQMQCNLQAKELDEGETRLSGFVTIEKLAFGTLVTKRNHMSLNGQDVKRGIFNHHHVKVSYYLYALVISFVNLGNFVHLSSKALSCLVLNKMHRMVLERHTFKFILRVQGLN